MSLHLIEKETKTIINDDGSEETTTVEKTKSIEKSNEPDYIKLYTKVWCEFNEIPNKWRNLFLALALRMTYANAGVPGGGQMVNTGKPWADDIMNECGWTNPQMLKRGLKALCDCKAIRHIARGVYQINPTYASRGAWKYNPRHENGGIENLIATFNFKNKTVDMKVIYAAEKGDPILKGSEADELVITQTTKTSSSNADLS